MTVTIAQLDTLTVYVPPPVAQLAHDNPQEKPGGTYRHFYAATVFADISGFTPLAEELATNGVRGAEELTAILNQVFEALITTAESHGGQVVKFGGDALSLIWPCESDDDSLAEATWRAAQGAFAMQSSMQQFAQIETRQGSFNLHMKIGVSAGRLLEVHAGGEYNRWEYVLAGAPMENMSRAENHAQVDEVVTDFEAWRLLGHMSRKIMETQDRTRRLPFRGVEVDNSFYKIIYLLDKLPAEPLSRPAWHTLDEMGHQKAAVILRNYIPGAISKVLEGGHRDMLAELKPMTVCFVGFEGIDYNNDPNAGPALSDFMRDAQQMIYRYEGSVNKLAVGDKGSLLLVLFGAPPFFHEDDEVRGVACALALLQVAERHNIKLRVGLTAGPLFAGPLGAPQRREYSVIGDKVNLAARLMQKAKPGQVYVDLSVQSKSSRFFEYLDLGFISIKGKTEPRHAFRALQEREQDTEMVMGYLLSNQELTGRDKEIDFFDQLTDKVWSGKGQILLLIGEAGVGKSRLAGEYVRRWMGKAGVSHGGDCVSYGEKTPYLPWRGILSSLAGLSPKLTMEQRVSRIEAVLHRLPETHSIKANKTKKDEDGTTYWLKRLPLVTEILGLKVPENDFTRTLPDKLRRDNLFDTIRAMIINEARHRRTLILLEDTHWSDELSLELAAHVAAEIRDYPILMMLAHRPLSASKKIPLGYQRIKALPNAVRQELNELDPEASLKLVENKLGVTELPDALAELIRSKGQGNPFFIEEMVNSLLEMDTLKVIDGRCIVTKNLSTIEMPDTVQKVVLTRLDRLPDTVKVTLKVAAVIGRTFKRDLLAEVHPWINDGDEDLLTQQLARLQADDFTRQEVKEDDLDFLFKHVITQEVAYETMLYSQRRSLHATIAHVMENRYNQNDDEIIDLLAYHYSRSDNREKALQYLQRAGQRALDGHANEAAISYFNEALAVAEELENFDIRYALFAGREEAYDRVGNRSAQQQDLSEMRKLALAFESIEQQLETGNRQMALAANLGEYDQATNIADEMVTLAHETHHFAWEARTLLNLGITYWRQGRYQQAGEVMQKLIEINGTESSEQLIATSYNYLGLIHTQTANYEQAREDYQQALELFQSIGDQAGQASTANNLGLLEASLGRYSEAKELYAQSLTICQTIGDKLREGISLNTLGKVETVLGEYDRAQEHLASSLEIRRKIGDRRGEAFGLHDLGFLYLALGQMETAVTHFDAACFLREELDEIGNLVASIAAKGAACLSAGDFETAKDCLEEAVKHLRQDSGSGEYPTQDVWWSYYQLCDADGRPEEAMESLHQAYQLVRQKAQHIDDPLLRISYLEKVGTNAKIIEEMVDRQLRGM